MTLLELLAIAFTLANVWLAIKENMWTWPTGIVSVILRGNSPYAQTGVFGAEAVRRVLRRQLAAVGFASPARAFGARNLLAAQAEEGYLAYEVKSV